VVVDPGVGTQRRPIAAQIGNQFFVGPDNGCLTIWLEFARRNGQDASFYHLTRPEFWLPAVSTVFHGRDIFAPAAAHLAIGTALFALGEPITDPILLSLPQPQPTPTGLRGEIIHIDHFGNLACNIRTEHLTLPVLRVQMGGETVEGLVSAFGERPAGSLVALTGSSGNLVISVVNGSAADRLNLRPGDPVEVSFVR
jgi:S-adenosylmethionine hydrolase